MHNLLVSYLEPKGQYIVHYLKLVKSKKHVTLSFVMSIIGASQMSPKKKLSKNKSWN